MRRRDSLLGALVAALAWAAPAGAAEPYLNLTSDAARDAGKISLTAIGSTSLTNIRYAELEDGVPVPLGTVGALPYFQTEPDRGDLGIHTQYQAASWRCDRLTRTFAVYATAPDGRELSATYENRTPSCAHRFELDGPLRARRGAEVTVDVRDGFDLGDATADFCTTAPRGGDPRCHQIAFAPGQTIASGSFRATRRGRWRVVVRTPQQTLRRTVSVGVRPRPRDRARLPSLLTTGDSLMDGPDALLKDRLNGTRAAIRTDIHVGSGLTRPFVVDWTRIPRRQVRERRPDAVVLFLGLNDESPIAPPGGDPVQCCGPDWVAQYARIARDVMRTYARRGAPVLWLNIPTPRDPRRQRNARAVNRALVQAADGLPTVDVVDINAVLSPGDVYQDSVTYRGRTVRVRQPDGVHLSVAGSRITARILIARLERSGVLR